MAFFPDLESKRERRKRYGSMIQIQDKAILEKEKKRKRDRAIRREKEKSKCCDPSELSGRSLSESDLVQHCEILSRKARKALALGIEIEGNEDEVIREGMSSKAKISKIRCLLQYMFGLVETENLSCKGMHMHERMNLKLAFLPKKAVGACLDGQWEDEGAYCRYGIKQYSEFYLVSSKVLGGDFNAIRNKGECNGCKGLITIVAAFRSVWLARDGLSRKAFFKAWCSWIAADDITSSLVVEVVSWSARKANLCLMDWCGI
ncbi:hypothetical protein GQ457_08G037050 [Hibiscus cannabinus]